MEGGAGRGGGVARVSSLPCRIASWACPAQNSPLQASTGQILREVEPLLVDTAARYTRCSQPRVAYRGIKRRASRPIRDRMGVCMSCQSVRLASLSTVIAHRHSSIFGPDDSEPLVLGAYTLEGRRINASIAVPQATLPDAGPASSCSSRKLHPYSRSVAGIKAPATGSTASSSCSRVNTPMSGAAASSPTMTGVGLGKAVYANDRLSPRIL